jgi:hypothetical protein
MPDKIMVAMAAETSEVEMMAVEETSKYPSNTSGIWVVNVA